MLRGQHWKAGLFAISAGIILAATIALVAGIRLNVPRNHYTVRFDESVSGLEPGAAVKFRGVQVGNVDEIRIPEDDITKVEVRVSIDKEMSIKTDTKATLSSVGITGIKFVDLQAGAANAPELAPGGRIESQRSFLESLSGTAQGAAEKLDVLLSNLIYITDRTKVDKLTGELEAVLVSINESSGQARQLLTTLESAAGHMDTLMVRVDGTIERNERHIDSSIARLDAALGGLDRTLAKIEQSDLIDNLSETAANTRDVAADLRGILGAHRRSISETLANLRETAANLNDFSRFIRDKPSLLLRSSTPKSPDLPGGTD